MQQVDLSKNKIWVNKYKYFSLLSLPVILALIVVATSFYQSKKTSPIYVANAGSLSECSESNAVKLVKPNVVKIENKTKTGTIYGSGFFDPSGYIVTNSHVIDTKGDITVYYPDGLNTKGILVSNDIYKDMAILTVTESGPKSLIWSADMNLSQPDDLMAIGYALNLPGESSVTKGAFSAVRDVEGIKYIQTDTPLNAGNSGGPLINACGEVEGVNSLAVDNASINLAISSKSAKQIINDLVLNKNVTYLSGDRNTILTNLLKTIGGFTSDQNVNDNTSTSGSGATNITPGVSSKNPSSSTQKGNINTTNACITGFSLSANKTTIQVNEQIFLYYPVYSNITWTGGGNFSGQNNTSASWSNSTAGTFTLTATYKTGITCSSSVKITVEPLPTRIDRLAAVYTYANPGYSQKLNTNVVNFGYRYMDSSNVDIEISSPLCLLVPVTADLKVYKNKIGTSGSSDREKLIYSGGFENPNIISDGNGRTITVPIGNLNITDADYELYSGKLSLYYSYDLIIHTPEQGSFTGYGNNVLFKL